MNGSTRNSRSLQCDLFRRLLYVQNRTNQLEKCKISYFYHCHALTVKVRTSYCLLWSNSLCILTTIPTMHYKLIMPIMHYQLIIPTMHYQLTIPTMHYQLIIPTMHCTTHQVFKHVICTSRVVDVKCP